MACCPRRELLACGTKTSPPLVHIGRGRLTSDLRRCDLGYRRAPVSAPVGRELLNASADRHAVPLWRPDRPHSTVSANTASFVRFVLLCRSALSSCCFGLLLWTASHVDVTRGRTEYLTPFGHTPFGRRPGHRFGLPASLALHFPPPGATAVPEGACWQGDLRERSGSSPTLYLAVAGPARPWPRPRRTPSDQHVCVVNRPEHAAISVDGGGKWSTVERDGEADGLRRPRGPRTRGKGVGPECSWGPMRCALTRRAG